MTKRELTKYLKANIEYFKDGADGCATIKLDDRLAVCIGWLDGYDPADVDLIHAEDAPTWCLNAGIKVHTSDSMKTDYEYINAPYFRNGEVWSTDVSLGYSEDIKALADYLLREYKAMKKLDIAEDDEILNYDSPDGYCRYIEAE